MHIGTSKKVANYKQFTTRKVKDWDSLFDHIKDWHGYRSDCYTPGQCWKGQFIQISSLYIVFTLFINVFYGVAIDKDLKQYLKS